MLLGFLVFVLVFVDDGNVLERSRDAFGILLFFLDFERARIIIERFGNPALARINQPDGVVRSRDAAYILDFLIDF